MTIQELKIKLLNDLAQIFPKEEILSFFYLLLNHKLRLTKIDIVLNPNEIINQTQLDFFLNALTQLKQEKPIQYIIGETEFYGSIFKLNKNVLIPRPETEELIEWVLKEERHNKEDGKPLRILDIGTGSGCIAISLAKHLPKATVFALDISQQALKITKQNAKLNNVNIHFIEGDILQPNSITNITSSVVERLSNEKFLSSKFDIIVSNPPYVRELEKQEIQNNVLQNEPHLALFVADENPLSFYDKIADFANENLNKNGELYVEINQYLGKETVELLLQKGFTNIKLKKDILGNDRMIKALR